MCPVPKAWPQIHMQIFWGLAKQDREQLGIDVISVTFTYEPTAWPESMSRLD